MDDVAAHVWDLAYSGHNTAGTFGYQVQNIATGTPPTAAAIASQVRTELTTELGRIDVATSTRLATAGYTAPPSAATNAAAVWDLSRSGHSTSGTFGEGVIVQTNNDKTGYGLSDGAITTAKFATGAIDATVIATDAFGALELADDAAAEIVTKLFDVADGVETGVTFRNAMRYIAAICAGKVSGAGTGTETFKGIGTNTTRVVVTADISGNRSAVTLS
jgi:hypothetical protein